MVNGLITRPTLAWLHFPQLLAVINCSVYTFHSKVFKVSILSLVRSHSTRARVKQNSKTPVLTSLSLMARGKRTVRLTFGYFCSSGAMLSSFFEKREAN